MFDKKVIRRRRAALAVFVALSVVLLTAYFGESRGGFLNSLQGGAQEAFAPIESGASKALKPVKDLVGWTGDTLDAKGENEELREEVERLRSDLARAQTAERDRRQLQGLVDLQQEEFFPQGTEPVTARVIGRSPTAWYASVKIDRGAGDGIEEDQPVVASGGLVGKVTRVTSGTSEVRLITDGESGVTAQVVPDGALGSIEPSGVGNPGELVLQFLEGNRRVTEGTTVITAGSTSSRLESLFPRGIPIGEVIEADLDDVELYDEVRVEPFADLRGMDYVQVLTAPSDTARAEVTPR